MLPLMFLSYKSDLVPGAHPLAKATTVYPVENELLFDFVLVAKTPNGTFFVKKRFTKINLKGPPSPVVIPGPTDVSSFDDTAKAYVFEFVDVLDFSEILLSRSQGKLELFLTMRVWWKKFFKEMLKFLTRTDGDTFNLARPDSPTAVESSFTHALNAKGVKTTHLDDQVEFKDIPCDLKARGPIDEEGRDLIFQKLEISLRLDKLPPADHKNIAMTLIAADWTKLYQRRAQFVNGHDTLRPAPWFTLNQPPTGDERSLQTWECNIARYLFTHAKLDRGQKIIDEVINNATAVMSKPVLDVVKQIRDDIDARMVTANHWGDLRENFKTEAYQRKLSDLFGEIHQNHWYASPVRFLRVLSGSSIEIGVDVTGREQVKLLDLPADVTGLKFEDDKKAQLILQFGVGHCGEHSFVSFLIVKKLMQAGNEAKFGCVISTGNANIDHAFVVGGFQIGEIIKTKNTKASSPGGIGKELLVWNLSVELILHKPEAGWVLDAYLDPSRQGRTLPELLARLTDPKLRGDKVTKHLRFIEQFKQPAPENFSVLDKPEGVPGV